MGGGGRQIVFFFFFCCCFWVAARWKKGRIWGRREKRVRGGERDKLRVLIFSFFRFVSDLQYGKNMGGGGRERGGGVRTNWVLIFLFIFRFISGLPHEG